MNSGQPASALFLLWEGFKDPAILLYNLLRRRSYKALVPILILSGLMMTLVLEWSQKQLGSFFFIIPLLYSMVASLGVALLHVRRSGLQVSTSRREITVRGLGGTPSTFVLTVVAAVSAIIILIVGALAVSFWIAVRLFRGSGGRTLPKRGTLASTSVGDLIWAEITNSKDGGSKIRPCIVVRKGIRNLEVLYCTSQEKRSADARYLQLMVDIGTGKDNFVNLKDVRKIGPSEFQRVVGALPSDVFRLIRSNAGL
jgi:hypothetical protein